ncbi:MAG: hypothetical protein JWP97_1468 [Labilithrix sp.]|nr:hypothetical protein [Labilithrix sp.]
MKQDFPTVDTRMMFRCMLVGLDDASTTICKGAMQPLQAVSVADTREACRRMSEVRPLIVLLATPGAEGAKADLPELTELASACGAEVLAVPLPPDPGALGKQILDALRKGEARRVDR